MDYTAALKDYAQFEYDNGRWTRSVWRRGSGPAVIVIHEMPGLHPDVIRFADRVAAAGMTVFLPSLFGQPGRPVSTGYALGEIVKGVCIRREFNAWRTGKSSPIVDWLRDLREKVHAECGGRGVGAVGMCFTGGFALAMMTEPWSWRRCCRNPRCRLPAGSKKRAAGIDASPAEIACARERFAKEDLHMIGLRFIGDAAVPDARFDTYKREFGDKFEAIELDAKDAGPGGMGPHSVLTINLVDRPGTPTKKAEERVIAFFKEKTGA